MIRSEQLYGMLVWAGLLFLRCHAADFLPTHTLFELQYADLVTLDKETATKVANVLTDVGALQITGIPRFGMVRKRALEDLAECFQTEGAPTKQDMVDGSKRLSCGAASHQGVSDPMNHICGEASARLRSAVDAATRQLFLALDLARHNATGKLMEPEYSSMSQLMMLGSHLEHLHAYFPPSTESADAPAPASASAPSARQPSPATLPYHTDAGLMIAMTTGLYAQPLSPDSTAGLYITLPDQTRARVLAKDDALIIMMGLGATQWLSPMFGKAFAAPSHALVAGLHGSPSNSRAWYGKMYLPPANAIIPSEGISFAEYHALQAAHSVPLSKVPTAARAAELYGVLPSACGHQLGGSYASDSRGHLQETPRFLSAMADACDASTEIMCWGQCMSIEKMSCGTDAVCWDYSTDAPSADPEQMCMPGGAEVCRPACPGSNGTSEDGYCYGTGTSMFMTGFTSIVQEEEGSTPCVNLLFTEWTLDNKGKFAAGCLGVFIMCVLIQLLSTLQMNVAQTSPSLKRKAALVLLYGVNTTLHYLAMLVAMTYSVELFCMVCAGLTVGFALFQVDLSAPPAGGCGAHAAGSSDPYKYDTYEGEKDLKKKLVSSVVEEGNCCD